MRKFALLPLIFGLVGFQAAQAQVRDLFAEFEAENAATPASVDSSSAQKAAAAPAQAAPAAAPAAPVAAPAAAPAQTAPATPAAAPAQAAPATPAAAPAQAAPATPAAAPTQAAPATPDTAAVSSSSSATVDSSAVATSAPVSDSAKADSVAKDSVAKIGQAYMANMNAAVDSARARDSIAALSSSSSAINLSSSSINRRDLLGPVKVSKVNSIDEMKGSYKSPRKALFLSLVIPGSGQLYVGGSKFTYARGAIYLAIEAGLWSGWYYKTVNQYDKQVKKYKNFADKHYSIGRYENGMFDLYRSLNDVDEENRFVERYMNSRESFCEALYDKAGKRGCYDSKTSPYASETQQKKYFGNNPENLGKEKKDGFYEESEVYQLIGGATYVLGWDDVDSVAVAGSLDLGDPNSDIMSLGYSSNREKYRDMRSKANDLADMQAWFIGGLILNHLVSAIDAAFTASSHNKELYQEDLSWYDHLRFDSGISFIDGFGVDVRASWGF